MYIEYRVQTTGSDIIFIFAVATLLVGTQPHLQSSTYQNENVTFVRMTNIIITMACDCVSASFRFENHILHSGI